MENKPLVSVVVITYNSAEFVIETLESIKSQTYSRVELIISDDASRDNTVELCRSWVAENGTRFERAEVIVPEKNGGISANVNRGFKAAKGEWIKLTAGDDILLDHLIEDNMQFVAKHPDARVVASDIQYFRSENGIHVDVTPTYKPSLLNYEVLSAEDQYQLYLRNYNKRINSLFINRQAFFAAGGCDEEFMLKEDSPLIGRLLKAGFKFYYFKGQTFKYRLHGNSVTSTNTKQKIYNRFHSEANTAFARKYIIPNVSAKEKALASYHNSVISLYSSTFLNNRNIVTLLLNKALTFPYSYFSKKIKYSKVREIASKYNITEFV